MLWFKQAENTMTSEEDKTIDVILEGSNAVQAFDNDCYDPHISNEAQMQHGILASIAYQLSRIADAMESANEAS
jgi:hypothetical protein